MKNNIKQMLKDASNKQQINDISKSIIENVNKEKVLLEPKIESKPKRSMLPFMFAGFATAGVLALVLVSTLIMNKDNSRPTEAPAEPITVIDFTDVESETVKAAMSRIQSQEAYNIINVCHTFNNISFTDVEKTPTKYLTVELENSIVNDLDVYMYNIEDMFSLVMSESTVSKNTNTNYLFDNDLSVTSSYYNYHTYFSEEVIEKKNEGEDNYKEKTSLDGIIDIDNTTYDFECIKTIKNSELRHNSKISLDETKYVTVEEIFGQGFNEFRYNYYYDDLKKDVLIRESLDSDFNTKQIDFKANIGKNNEVKMHLYKNDNYYLFAKLDSREKEELYITKESNQFTYEFKNSKNKYTK